MKATFALALVASYAAAFNSWSRPSHGGYGGYGGFKSSGPSNKGYGGYGGWGYGHGHHDHDEHEHEHEPEPEPMINIHKLMSEVAMYEHKVEKLEEGALLWNYFATNPDLPNVTLDTPFDVAPGAWCVTAGQTVDIAVQGTLDAPDG